MGFHDKIRLKLENKTRKAPLVGANSSSVFAFDMHFK